MRRTHLLGHAPILKWLFVHVSGSNLRFSIQTFFGVGNVPLSLHGTSRP